VTASISTPEPSRDIPAESTHRQESAADPIHDLAGSELAGSELAGSEYPEGPVRELAEIPAVEVITRAAVMLMSAAAEKLGLAEDGDRYLDRDEARRLITALAGLYAAVGDDLGAHRRPIADALRGLQAAFRDASPIADPPGQGPGESIRRPPPL
jgi:uncharacterized protein DUF1844